MATAYSRLWHGYETRLMTSCQRGATYFVEGMTCDNHAWRLVTLARR